MSPKLPAGGPPIEYWYGVTVTVDEKKIIDWKADYERLTLYPGWRVPHKNVLFIGSWTVIFRFGTMELKPITGAGRRLR